VIHLLTGQSNSLGTTQFEGDTLDQYGPGTDAADADTSLWWDNVSAAADSYPPLLYGDSGSAWTTLQVQQGGGSDPAFWGPEFGLGRRLSALGERDFAILKCSRGGGGNTLWDSTVFATSPDDAHMWGQIVDTTTAAVGALQAAGYRVELGGFYYIQGESNTVDEAAVAGERLQRLIGDVASLFEELEPGSTATMRTIIGEIAASDSTGPRARTTAQQQALATGDPAITFVQTSDLPLKEDGIHFGKDEKLEIGQRFADAWVAGGR